MPNTRSVLLRPVAAAARTLRKYTGYGLPDRRPVFIHIPKTAGRSIGRYDFDVLRRALRIIG